MCFIFKKLNYPVCLDKINVFKSLKKCKLFECGHPYCLDCLNEYKYNCCSYSEIIDLFL